MNNYNLLPIYKIYFIIIFHISLKLKDKIDWHTLMLHFFDNAINGWCHGKLLSDHNEIGIESQGQIYPLFIEEGPFSISGETVAVMINIEQHL